MSSPGSTATDTDFTHLGEKPEPTLGLLSYGSSCSIQDIAKDGTVETENARLTSLFVAKLLGDKQLFEGNTSQCSSRLPLVDLGIR